MQTHVTQGMDFCDNIKKEFHYKTAIHVFQLNIWDKEFSKQAWSQPTIDHLSLSISKVGWDRGGWKGSPSAGAPALKPSCRAPPIPSPGRPQLAQSQEGQKEVPGRGTCLPDQSFTTQLLPPFCLAFQMTQLPSNFLSRASRTSPILY